MIKTPLTGRAIKEYLLQVGEGYAFDFYRQFKIIFPEKKTSYDSVRRYFYILRELGLIEYTRTIKGRGKFPVRLHRIVPGMEDDPRWDAPQVELYPATKLGRERYRKRIERGEPVPRGRREGY